MNSERVKNFIGSLVRLAHRRLVPSKNAERSPEDGALPDRTFMEGSRGNMRRGLLAVVVLAALAVAIGVAVAAPALLIAGFGLAMAGAAIVDISLQANSGKPPVTRAPRRSAVLLGVAVVAVLAVGGAGTYLATSSSDDGLAQETEPTATPFLVVDVQRQTQTPTPPPVVPKTLPLVVTPSPTPTPPTTPEQSLAVTPSPTPPPPLSTPTPVPPPTDFSDAPGFPVIVDEQELYVVDAESGESRLILRSTGWISEQRWSPDGTRLAFRASSPEGHSGLYVADVTGGKAAVRKVLTGDEGWGLRPFLWSPDGNRLAVLGTSTVAPNSYAVSVRVIDIEGGETVEVYSEEADSYIQLDLLHWLSDGNRMLAVRDGDLVTIDMLSGEMTTILVGDGKFDSSVRALSPDESQVALAVFSEDEGCEDGRPAMTLVTVSVADGTTSEVTSGLCEITHVAWSPDGGEISFTVVGGESGAYVLNVASGETRRLTESGEQFDVYSEWLADGSGLVIRRSVCWGCCGGGGGDWLFVPSAGGSEEVLASNSWQSGFGGFAPDSQRYLYSNDAVRIRTLDGEEIALTEPDATSAYFGLAWSPDGDRVAYVRGPSDQPRRYAVDVETGDVTTLPAPSEYYFKVSPDGSMAAFTRTIELPEATWQQQLWVSGIDGADERLLVDADVRSFEWSADSQSIAYVLQGDNSIVNVIDVATTAVQQLVNLNGPYRISSWSPDGSYLALTGDDGALVVIEIATGAEFSVGQAAGAAQWSPDGRRLVYQTGQYPDTHIAVLDVESGETTELTSSTGTDTAPSWSPDGDQVAFWRQLSGYPADAVVGLYVVSVGSLEEQELARFEGNGGSTPVWSPDRSSLAVLRGTGSGSVLLLVAADGSGVVQIATMSGRSYEDLRWPADGRQLIFSSLYVGM